MGNQQPNGAGMLDDEVLDKIASGEITSRRQVYKIVGRTKKLRLWMDHNNILIPTKNTKQTVIMRMRDLYTELGRIPVASDNWALTSVAQNHFGTWNHAVFEAFGKYNQRRYIDFTDTEMLDFIRLYIKRNEHLPTRDEFNGSEYPYWETYYSRFNVSRWSDILMMVEESPFPKHGWGRKQIFNGMCYLSNEELQIGKWLTVNEIHFLKEVPYGRHSNYVFDFYLPEYNVYIEYYGIFTADYKQRIEKKRAEYRNRHVIEIFKHDNTIKKLATEVQRLQSLPD